MWCSLDNTIDHQPDQLRTRPAHAYERISPTAISFVYPVNDVVSLFLFNIYLNLAAVSCETGTDHC
jgi:hypothetical protein